MPKLFSFLAAIVIGIAATPLAAAGGHGAATGRAAAILPMVHSAEVDAARSQLILSGKYFGATAPVLVVGEARLEISQFTSTRIVAALPKTLRPGAYLLTVQSTESQGGAVPFYVQIQPLAVLAAK